MTCLLHATVMNRDNPLSPVAEQFAPIRYLPNACQRRDCVHASLELCESSFVLVKYKPSSELKTKASYTQLHLTPLLILEMYWSVDRGNIPGSDVSRGDTLVDYIQPFPVRGTGAHRFIFVLFEQNKHVNYGYIRRPSPW